MAKKTRVKTKIKRKKWFNLVAPKIFHNVSLGETRALSIADIKGRLLDKNLMELTRNMRKQHILVSFKVKETKENQGYCEAVGYKIMESYIKKMVRRGSSFISDSFILKTKDGRVMRIKPIIITRGLANQQTCSDLRKKAKDYLVERISKDPLPKVMNDLIQNKLQKDMAMTLKKTFPVKICEIKTFKLENLKPGKKILKVKPKKEDSENAKTNSE